jgi:transposase-like protein
MIENMKCVCGSMNIKKSGIAVTRKGKKQRYFCNECGRTFLKSEDKKCLEN